MKKKIITTLLTLLLITFALSIPVFADPPGSSSLSGINNPWGTNSQIRSAGNKVIGIVWAVGGVASVIFLMMLGIRYMIASPDEKAQVKQQLIPFVFGAILTFGAINIIGIVGTFASNIFK